MKVNNMFSVIARSGATKQSKPRLLRALRALAMTPILILALLINPFGVGINCAQEDPPVSESSRDKISLDLKNVDIVELLRIISLKTGKTIVPGRDVAGRITVYLSNVAFDDVLDIILLTQGLALNHRGNIYYIMSEAEYRKNFGQDYIDQRKIQTVRLAYAKPAVIFNALGQLKSDVGKIVVDESSGTVILIDIPEKLELLNKTIKDLDRPLTTVVYDLNYIKAADAKTQFDLAVTPGTGEVIIDERSGKAIISDLPRKMQKMNMLVRELDEASRQVYVEADIVELTLSDEFERGIDWERAMNAAVADGLSFAGYFPATLTAAYQKISVGTLAANNYTAILNFLNTYGKTNIISQPRISVVNNEEANVMVGVREAYITQTQSQATATTVTSETVEFIDVGVKLKIVPKIGADGFITMKLKPEVSSVKETIETALGSRIPIVQTAQSETVVKVKDGTMIMIAGMTRIEDSDSIKGWPVLAKMPFVGAFFSNRTKSKVRTEVIIFLTPHLSSGDVGLRGDGLTKILPMEHLPEYLQDKVVRDRVVDRGLYSPETMKKELTEKQAIEIAATEVDERTIEKAEKAKNDKLLKKLADKAAKEVAEAKRIVDKAAKATGDKAEVLAKLAAEKAAQEAAKQAEKEKAVARAVKVAQKEKDRLAKQAEDKAAKEAEKEKAADKAAKAADKAAEKAAEIARAAEKKAVKQVVSAEVKTPILKETAKDYYRKGLQAQAESDPQQATYNFIKAIELDNKFVAAYNNLGIIYEQEHKLDQAEAMYLKVIAINPNFCSAYSNLALFNEERKDFFKALEYWKKRALCGDPDDPWSNQARQRVKELEN